MESYFQTELTGLILQSNSKVFNMTNIKHWSALFLSVTQTHVEKLYAISENQHSPTLKCGQETLHNSQTNSKQKSKISANYMQSQSKYQLK